MIFNPFKSKNKETYYDIILYPNTVHDYNRVFDLKLSNTISTQKTICFKNLDWGISKDEVLKKYRKPDYILNRKLNQSNHCIFFLKLQKEFIKSVIQIHFIDNKLVFASREYKYTPLVRINHLY